MTKRLFSTILVFVLILGCLLAVTSCKKNKGNDHTHDYKSAVTDATCTQDGVITYTCSCGDSYTEKGEAALGHKMQAQEGKAATCTETGLSAFEKCTRCDYATEQTAIPALGHCYVIQNIKYPSPTEDGERTMKCENCEHSETFTISAASFAFPTGSEIIAAIIGEMQLFASVEEGTQLALKQISEPTSTSDYTGTIAVSLGEVSLKTVNGVPEGYVKFEMDIFEEGNGQIDEFNAYIYLQGDILSIEIDVPGGDPKSMEYNITEVLYSIIFARFGLTGDDINAVAYVFGEFAGIADDLINLGSAIVIERFNNIPQLSEEAIAEIQAIFALVEADALIATDNGDGTVTYTTNVEALGHVIDALDGKTVEEIINDLFGDGSADSLKEFALGLPGMKVRDVSDYAIAIAEANDVDTKAIYAFVDLVIYVGTGKSINIESQIQDNYDVAIIELLGADADDLASVTESMTEAFEQIYPHTIDELYNLMSYGNANYIPEGQTEAFSFLAQLKMVLTMLDDMAYAELTFDSEGNLLYVDTYITGESGAHARLTVLDNGFEILATSNDGSVEMYIKVDDYGFTMYVYQNGTELMSAALTVTEYSETQSELEGYLIVDGEKFIDIYAYNDNGELTELDIDINGYVTEYREVYGLIEDGYWSWEYNYDLGDYEEIWVDTSYYGYYDEAYQVFVDMLDIEYERDGEDGSLAIVMYEGPTYSITFTEREGYLRFDYQIWNADSNTNGGLEYLAGSATYTYTLNEEGVITEDTLDMSFSYEGVGEVMTYHIERANGVVTKATVHMNVPTRDYLGYDEETYEAIYGDYYIVGYIDLVYTNEDGEIELYGIAYDKNGTLAELELSVVEQGEGHLITIEIPEMLYSSTSTPGDETNSATYIENYLALYAGLYIEIK